MKRELTDAVRYFTEETGIMSGLSVACGTKDWAETAMGGENIREETVFDLASLTKLFTLVCTMKLREEGRLDLSRSAFSYDPRFPGLRDLSLQEMISFRKSLQTPGRIDGAEDRQEAERRLFAVRDDGPSGKRAYSDIPAMVMKYVLESAAGQPFFECVRERVLIPAGMHHTWARVPENRRRDCQTYRREHRIENGKMILREGTPAGVPHDPKAAVLQGDSGDLCGHAGLFSTIGDMIRFCQSLLRGDLLSADSLAEIAVNRTGRRLPDGTYTQYLGYLCYLKHPDQYFSEVPVYMGGSAFGLAGFTGNHAVIDPEKGIFSLYLGNRVSDRLTVLIPGEGKEYSDYGLRKDGLGTFRWPDGETVLSSVNYVHQKDSHFHNAVEKVLGESLNGLY